MGDTAKVPASRPIPKAGTRRITGRVTATERFHAEARRKKIGPVACLLGVIAAAFLVAVGFILLGDREREDVVQYKFEALLSEAAKRYAERDLEGAIAKYQEAVAAVEGQERYRIRVIEVKGRIKSYRQEIGLRAAADRRFAAYKARVDKHTSTDLNDLVAEGDRLRAEYDGTSVRWISDLDSILSNLGMELEKERGRQRKLDFILTKREIDEKYHLRQEGGSHDWSGAIQAWRDYQAQEGVAAADRKRAETEIGTLCLRARSDFERTRRPAARLVEQNRLADALTLLRKERPRFSLAPEAAKEIDKLIRELDR